MDIKKINADTKTKLTTIFKKSTLKYRFISENPVLTEMFNQLKPDLSLAKIQHLDNTFNEIKATDHEILNYEKTCLKNKQTSKPIYSKIVNQTDLLLFNHLNINLTSSLDFIAHDYPLIYKAIFKNHKMLLSKILAIANKNPMININANVDLQNINDLIQGKTDTLDLYNPTAIDNNTPLKNTATINIKQKTLNTIYKKGCINSFFQQQFYSYNGHTFVLNTSRKYELQSDLINTDTEKQDRNVILLTSHVQNDYHARFNVFINTLNAYYQHIIESLIAYTIDNYKLDYIQVSTGESVVKFVNKKPLGNQKMFIIIDKLLKKTRLEDLEISSIINTLIYKDIIRVINFEFFKNANSFFRDTNLKATYTDIRYDNITYPTNCGLNYLIIVHPEWKSIEKTDAYLTTADLMNCVITQHDQLNFDTKDKTQQLSQLPLTNPKQKKLTNFIGNMNKEYPMPKSYNNPFAEKKAYITKNAVYVPDYIENTADSDIKFTKVYY